MVKIETNLTVPFVFFVIWISFKTWDYPLEGNVLVISFFVNFYALAKLIIYFVTFNFYLFDTLSENLVKNWAMFG